MCLSDVIGNIRTVYSFAKEAYLVVVECAKVGHLQKLFSELDP